MNRNISPSSPLSGLSVPKPCNSTPRPITVPISTSYPNPCFVYVDSSGPLWPLLTIINHSHMGMSGGGMVHFQPMVVQFRLEKQTRRLIEQRNQLIFFQYFTTCVAKASPFNEDTPGFDRALKQYSEEKGCVRHFGAQKAIRWLHTQHLYCVLMGECGVKGNISGRIRRWELPFI